MRKFSRLNSLLLALLLFPGLSHALTLSGLRSQARDLALDNGNRLRFSTSTIDSFLNEGQRIAVIDTKAIVRSGQFELAVGTTYYSLPNDYYQMRRLTLRYLILNEVSPDYLDGRAGLTWETSSSLPTNYFIAFSSRTKIGFYPFPNNTSSTGTVRYEYFAQASDMSAITDEPFSGATEIDPYGYILAYYAAFRMAAIDGRADLAMLYRTEFYEGLDRMKREVLARPSYRPNIIPGSSGNKIGP